MEITRGDYKSFKFKRTRKKDKSVIADRPSEMYITFKIDAHEEEALFQKRLGDGSITYSEEDNYYRFAIIPDDTDDLEYGTYFYDVEVIASGNKPRTILKGVLDVTEEYTHKANEV